MRWVEDVARMDQRSSSYWVLVGKADGKRPLGRSRSRWEINIEMDLQEVVLRELRGLIWLRIRTGGGYL